MCVCVWYSIEQQTRSKNIGVNLQIDSLFSTARNNVSIINVTTERTHTVYSFDSGGHFPINTLVCHLCAWINYYGGTKESHEIDLGEKFKHIKLFTPNEDITFRRCALCMRFRVWFSIPVCVACYVNKHTRLLAHAHWHSITHTHTYILNGKHKATANDILNFSM